MVVGGRGGAGDKRPGRWAEFCAFADFLVWYLQWYLADTVQQEILYLRVHTRMDTQTLARTYGVRGEG